MLLTLTHNSGFDRLASQLATTIPNGVELRVFRTEGEADGFRGERWYQQLADKWHNLARTYRAEAAQFVGTIDADTIFIRPDLFLRAIESFARLDLEIVALQEGPCGGSGWDDDSSPLVYENKYGPINTGLVVFKRGEIATQFLNEMERQSTDFRSAFLGDQDFANSTIVRLGIGRRVGVFNPCRFIHGCCGPRSDAAFFHATCCFDLGAKILSIENAKRVARL